MSKEVNLSAAYKKAREIHFGAMEDGSQAPGRHKADGMLMDLLADSLLSGSSATRRGRSRGAEARKLWHYDHEADVAKHIDQMTEKSGGHEPQDGVDRDLHNSGLVTFEDQYTAERVRNMKTEVLSRHVEGLIMPQTNIVNNFFRTIRADGGETLGQFREMVTHVEVLSDWPEYYEIDPDRGDIPSLEIGMTQYSERVNPMMRMYGVKLEYENYFKRVLRSMHIADWLAMVSVGWAKASAMQREYDASKYLTNYLGPEPVFDNNAGATSALGQLTGVGINGKQNGTFSLDYDFPRLLDYMQHELQMSTDNLIMLLPKNAWAFMNTRQGYRRFLGTDRQPLYQSPNFTSGPQGAMQRIEGDDRYGIRVQGVGYNSPRAAAEYLAGTPNANAARAAETMPAGPMPFIPAQVPNWQHTFQLPNSAFGPMRVVLTPFAQANHRFYAENADIRNDDVTEKPRPVMTTDMLFFDGNRPMYMIESIPPTSWTASNEEFRKSVLVMVEGYAMANAARGQQACTVNGAVLDHEFTHDLWLDATKVKITDKPMGDGLTNN